MDNAATKAVSKKALSEMIKYSAPAFANPSSLHEEGESAREALLRARARTSQALFCLPEEILFTSGATESNNSVIRGVVDSFKKENPKLIPHIITTEFEHHSVLVPIQNLEKQKLATVTYLKINGDGFIKASQVREELKKNTCLVSVMYANNEIGTIQPLKEISLVLRNERHLGEGKHKAYPVFHSDMAQAPGQLPIRVDKLGLDLASLSSQKFGGPKGVGILFKKRGINLTPQILGGDQELGLRAGTENLPSIIGMAKALEEADKNWDLNYDKLIDLQDYFHKQIIKHLGKNITLNGSLSQRLPSNLNYSFEDVEGEQMVIELDTRGVAVSTGSACTTEKVGPSHVIMSLENNIKRAVESVRFSFDSSLTKKQIDYTVKVIKEVINKQSKLK